MELTDALIVSAAGIAVVFFGLIITNFLILSLPHLLKLQKAMTGGNREKQIDAEPVGNDEPLNLAQAEPDVVAVISTVLEIERRLNFSRGVSRYTFKSRKTPRTGLVRS